MKSIATALALALAFTCMVNQGSAPTTQKYLKLASFDDSKVRI